MIASCSSTSSSATSSSSSVSILSAPVNIGRPHTSIICLYIFSSSGSSLPSDAININSMSEVNCFSSASKRLMRAIASSYGISSAALRYSMSKSSLPSKLYCDFSPLITVANSSSVNLPSAPAVPQQTQITAARSSNVDGPLIVVMFLKL